MNDAVRRALKTAAQAFVGTVVGLWSAAAVFSTEGTVDIEALTKFGIACVAAAIATGLSLVMSLAGGTLTEPKGPDA